ncbi:HlyD family efflux transporter periplasmic adaptor subunit, partial [Chamaesiphon polymorphus]
GEVIKLSVTNAQDSRVDRMLVKEGDRVQKNQVIAVLQGIDRKQADLRDALTDVKLRQVELGRVTRIDVKKSQVTAQNAVIARLQAQLTSTRKRQEAAIVSAVARLRNAETDYQQRSRLFETEVGLLSARAKLSNAEAEYQRRQKFDRTGDSTLGAKARLSNAQEEYRRNQVLYESGAISNSQLDKALEAVTSAQASVRERQVDTQTQLDKAAEDLASARAALREKEIEVKIQLDKTKADLLAARETLNERQAELEQTIQTLNAEIEQERAKLAELQEVRPSDVILAQAQLEKAKIAVEQKQAALRDSEVRVPVAGQILKINTRIGEQVNTTQGIVELAQTDRMYASVEVPEIDISKIKAGQPAVITSEYNSFKGSLQGVVEQIGLQVGRKQAQEVAGTNPASDKEARIVTVKVRIAPADSLKVAQLTNIQVRVRIPFKP